MAVSAAQSALSNAGIIAAEIDLLVCAASVAYQSIPATAPLVQRKLGITDGSCASFDANATCLSFLAAADFTTALVSTGRYKNALLISSEVASRALPWAQAPLTAALFGDGAGAAVLSLDDSGSGSGIVASLMETYAVAYEVCRLGAGGTRYDFHADRDEFTANSFFEMDGKALFRYTIAYFEPFLDRLLEKAGWRRDEVDLVIPHQASDTALAHLAKRCGFAPEKIINIMHDHGNQIAASLPTALDHAYRSGRLKPGMRAILVGTSAGLSLGGLALLA